jgi:tryptophanyl-tRNA synthetase
VQHLEMARDIASSFNHLYGEHFTLPEVVIEEQVATLAGLDGRKMSKSYDNTIPLFAAPAQLKKLIASIVTDSRAPGEPKEVEGSALFQLYQAFATPEEVAAMRQAYADGIAWGEAKERLLACIDREIAPMRARYDDFMAHPEKVEAILQAGAHKARALAVPFVQRLRGAVGLRSLAEQSTGAHSGKAVKTALPGFKQYREADGKFYFKLVDAQGRLLLQSRGLDAPRQAGQCIARLQQEGASALAALAAQLQPLEDEALVHAALAQLQAAAQ